VPEELRGIIAGIMLSPEMKAANSMHCILDNSLVEVGLDSHSLNDLLQEQGEAVAEGDFAHARRSLAAQASALEQMFHYLFRCATVAQKHSQDLFERYMRLALKAQAQAMRTQTALGRLSPKPRAKAPAVPPPPAAATRPASPPPKAPVPAPVSPRPVTMPHPVAWEGFQSRTATSLLVSTGSERLNGLSAPKR